MPFEVWYLTKPPRNEAKQDRVRENVSWDLDMLSGYPYRFLRAADGATPSSFWKCRLGERLQKRLKTSNTTALWIQGWQVAAYWQAVWEARSAGVEVWLRGRATLLRVSHSVEAS